MEEKYINVIAKPTHKCNYAVFDALNPELCKKYLQLPPIKVDTPVFILGTDGNPELTKEAILSLF